MKPFRFRPQRVLDWRLQAVDQARADLTRAIAILHRAEGELCAIVGQRHLWETQLHDRRMAGLTASEWALDWWRLQELRNCEAEAQAAYQRARAGEAARRCQLEEVRRQASSLSKLREQRLEEHRQFMNACEQQELDEWATIRRGRNPAWPSAK